MPPKKDSAASSKPSHPSYRDMIKDAIINLKERNGSSRPAIKKYILASNKIPVENKAAFDSQFNRALRAGVEKGDFAQPKGPSGTTKLAKPAVKPAAKPAAKKKTVTKKKDATAVKKATAKKSTATKKAAPKKESPVKGDSEEKEKKPSPEKKSSPKKKTTATAKSTTAKKSGTTANTKRSRKTKPSGDAIQEVPTTLHKTKSGRVTKTTAKAAEPKKRAAKKASPSKK
ncbi:hypothetical protein KEM56_000538 [Ascosphaera pollenicola]|nr:hypothetical protein KEM56_000538 [Ascosphaera pollenicola]